MIDFPLLTLLNKSQMIGILSPVLTLLLLAILRFAHAQLMNAINGAKDDLLAKVDEVKEEVTTVTGRVDKHERVLYGSEAKDGLIAEVAYIRGREDVKRETAQLANAAASVAQAIQHEDRKP